MKGLSRNINSTRPAKLLTADPAQGMANQNKSKGDTGWEKQ
jgi:hypothetical protein